MCGSWSIILVSILYTAARSCTNFRLSGGICGSTCVFLSDPINSLNVFSTRATNFGFAFPKATTSSLYSTRSAALAASPAGAIPNASASRAFRFAIAHSFVHLGGARSFFTLPVQFPQRTLCLLRPQGHVSVTNAWHGESSGHAAGA